jgi:hypothetical protein
MRRTYGDTSLCRFRCTRHNSNKHDQHDRGFFLRTRQWKFVIKNKIKYFLFRRRTTSSYMLLFLRNSPQWARASSFVRFLDHTQRRTTVGTTPLDEWSARSRDLCLTTHNTHNRQIPMPPVGFEPAISAGEQQQTYALDRAETGPGISS